ncbi:transcription repressor NadR [Pectinatus haikarae]|uniref:Transcriptional regulator of NAD metabolism n=1 Tax=Pectinatus haikarae TaxID=349096 RepID=A0ABT9Y706_9FIRM|nr:transcription repressor NadR [Pectinatus haikarae]MDQ0203612.1 transcriptional regulator of NAD metabolism [Pectinatus haikarae]
MTGEERRKIIIDAIKNSNEPLSGGALGKLTGVSRQVVVQDIALLRAQEYPVLATNRGYIFSTAHKFTRILKMQHSNEQTEDELKTIVDLGGTVVDVMINHRVYGKMLARLNIHSRRDVNNFMQDIKMGKSTPLMNITSGYHFHTVSADSQEALAEIESALHKKGYLAEILPYEQI